MFDSAPIAPIIGPSGNRRIPWAYFHDKKIRHHLDWRSLEPHLATIRPKRLILTHFSPDMLSRLGSLTVEAAEDGKIISL
jgi:phosphoribosyl 1,2-cyclic phosphodiesterase